MDLIRTTYDALPQDARREITDEGDLTFYRHPKTSELYMHSHDECLAWRFQFDERSDCSRWTLIRESDFFEIRNYR